MAKSKGDWSFEAVLGLGILNAGLAAVVTLVAGAPAWAGLGAFAALGTVEAALAWWSRAWRRALGSVGVAVALPLHALSTCG